jgi:hypothetical protein
MAGQEEFVNSVNFLMEGLWPTISPHEIIKFNDNLVDSNKFTALVLVWSGVTANSITKKVYKVWKNGGNLQYAEIAKAEWPVGI